MRWEDWAIIGLLVVLVVWCNLAMFAARRGAARAEYWYVRTRTLHRQVWGWHQEIYPDTPEPETPAQP